MIEEQFVSFETARMLKEAGFDVECDWFYINDGSVDTGIVVRSTSTRDHNMGTGFLSRPTQALAERWLREVHRIVVDTTFIPPLFDGVNWQYFIGNMDDMVWEGDFEPSERKYATYEAAFEAGLQEAIKLIKK